MTEVAFAAMPVNRDASRCRSVTVCACEQTMAIDSGKNPQVTAVIPAFNAEETILETLDSLRASRTPFVEIIVVDDGSTDLTQAVVNANATRHTGCRLLSLPANSGAGAARNAGTRAASTPLVFFVDSDVIIERETLGHLVQTLLTHRAAAVVGVYRERNVADTPLSHFTTFFSAFTYLGGGDGKAADFGSQCALVDRQTFLDAGGFDEILPGATVEDLHLGARLTDGGSGVALAAQARVRHNRKYSFLQFIRNYFRKGRVYAHLRRSGMTSTGRQGYGRPAYPLSMLLAAVSLFCLALSPFSPFPALPAAALLQVVLLLSWRDFLSAAKSHFGLPSAAVFFFLKQLALVSAGTGALVGLILDLPDNVP